MLFDRWPKRIIEHQWTTTCGRAVLLCHNRATVVPQVYLFSTESRVIEFLCCECLRKRVASKSLSRIRSTPAGGTNNVTK